MPTGKRQSTSPASVAVSVATRDPSMNAILLTLFRLNRIPAMGHGLLNAAAAGGLKSSATGIMVGYVVSLEDAEFFHTAVQEAGNPPSVALIPRDASPAVFTMVGAWATSIVRLPEDSQVIADAVRAQSGGIGTPKSLPESRAGKAEAST
jgi:hypothetical protein